VYPTTHRAPFRNSCRRGGCSGRVSDLRLIDSAQTPFALDLSHCPEQLRLGLFSPGHTLAASYLPVRNFLNPEGLQGSPRIAGAVPAYPSFLWIYFRFLNPINMPASSGAGTQTLAALQCLNPPNFGPRGLWYRDTASASQPARTRGPKRRSSQLPNQDVSPPVSDSTVMSGLRSQTRFLVACEMYIKRREILGRIPPVNPTTETQRTNTSRRWLLVHALLLCALSTAMLTFAVHAGYTMTLNNRQSSRSHGGCALSFLPQTYKESEVTKPAR